jgi:hypothetical protein
MGHGAWGMGNSLPSSLFSVPSSLFLLPCSFFPVPSSFCPTALKISVLETLFDRTKRLEAL